MCAKQNKTRQSGGVFCVIQRVCRHAILAGGGDGAGVGDFDEGARAVRGGRAEGVSQGSLRVRGSLGHGGGAEDDAAGGGGDDASTANSGAGVVVVFHGGRTGHGRRRGDGHRASGAAHGSHVMF